MITNPLDLFAWAACAGAAFVILSIGLAIGASIIAVSIKTALSPKSSRTAVKL